MLNFFDYVYYKVCRYYAKRENPNGAGISGLAVIAALQTANIMILIFLICIIIERKIVGNKLWFLGIYLLLLVADGFRYNRLNYPVLHEKWKDELENRKIRNQLLVLFYISVSSLFAIGLAIYIGSKEW